MTLDIQFLSTLASTGTGIWFGASFDTYKRFTGGSQRFRWTLIINDILFWILQALVFFYVLFIVNHGEIRFYLFLALLLGYSIYRALFETIYLRILERLITFGEKTIDVLKRTIKVLIINPSNWLLKTALTLSMIVINTLWRMAQILLKVVLFPFRWLGNKYVQAFGIPFHSFYKKTIKVFKKIKYYWRKWFNKHDDE